MKQLPALVLSLFITTSAFASESACRLAVERQNPEFASESAATPEIKSNLIDQILQGESTLDIEDARRVVRLLRASGTLAFSFSNDAGVWLVIVRKNDCVEIEHIQVQEI